jgi:ABC-type sugar transport system permease subunit
MYDLAFSDLHYGNATAVSFVLAAIVFAISQVQLRLKRLTYTASIEGGG